MASPRFIILLLSALAACNAGPLGPLPNVTSMDLGLKEGSCALGDVVYMSGDEFPGASPCERCACASGDVKCSKQRCEPRPGCKALHRPDHCCPTYQCDCEQEGRMYGNGEKLVDPQDPCRVCYCQGGEVVCRRIACFVRDDCRPRLVPGRCCPEYDNCPLRGVTSLPASPTSNTSSIEDITINAGPLPSMKPIKQEFTIKEITPVSEIPIITDVKVKEILPPSKAEDVEYSSSKSPLIPREATSEKNVLQDNYNLPSSQTSKISQISSSPSDYHLSTTPESGHTESKSTSDLQSSEISLSIQDTKSGEIYPSIIPLMGGPSIVVASPMPLTTKAPMMILQEEDSPYDHNPAFPPIPDDLSVLSNREDETIPEQNLDNDHVPHEQEIINMSTITSTTTTESSPKDSTSTTINVSEPASSSTESGSEISSDSSMANENYASSTETPNSRENSMLNLRSIIPTEILSAPSLISDENTGELLNVTESSIEGTSDADENFSTETTQFTEFISSREEITEKNIASDTFNNITEKTTYSLSSFDENTSPTSKNTHMTSQTELSSITIETSDQNPQDNKDSIEKDFVTTTDSPIHETTLGIDSFSDVSMISTAAPIEKISEPSKTVVTEYFVTPYYPDNESVTDAVEVIKVYSDGHESSEIAVRPKSIRNNNALTDLIKLVDDVASITDHTDEPNLDNQQYNPSTISNSEELLPVNAGYKSKNNNWNLNSITEVPYKNKNSINVNKQKIMEIEDDDTDNITDSPAPYDKVEPTTRRPIIDNVSDNKPENRTDTTNKKDIEIITQSYVPTLSKRPTKVVLEEDNDKPLPEEVTTARVDTTINDFSENNFTNGTTVSEDATYSTDAEEKVVELSTEEPLNLSQ